jgi:demethylmenaquinone methyltransferase/2-methoxy-6-polyprenyl-1,4-benzoquinol methylase
VQDSRSPLQSYYASRAAEYERIYQKPERQDDLRQLEAWLPTLFVGATVLEVACGTGYWTRFIAAAAASVVGIDSAPETLRIAERRVAASNVEFLVGDAYAISRMNRAFDAAFAGFWLSHVPIERQAEFLLGLHAALDPGARVVLLDNVFVPGSSSEIAGRDDRGNTYQLRSLSDGSTHRILKNFPTETELHALAKSVGASGTYRRWQYYWAFQYRAPGPRGAASAAGPDEP